MKRISFTKTQLKRMSKKQMQELIDALLEQRAEIERKIKLYSSFKKSPPEK